VLDWLDVLRYSAPVGLAAQGEAVAQRAGVLNIGLEGAMLAAAYAAVAAAQASGSPWLGLALGAAVGACVLVAGGAFTVVLSADQVVVGTAVNLAALGATSTLFQSRYGRSGQLMSVPALPVWLPGVDAGSVTLFGVAALAALWLWKSGYGLVLRSVGEYPEATEAAGYSAVRARLAAVAVAGVMAGLAGGYLAVGVSGTFVENMTAGRGFVAIAMVTFGRLRPWAVLGASLLVGVVERLQFGLQGSGVALPAQFFVALPYLVALGALLVSGKGGGLPAQLGIPFRSGR
jgi:simple sugar transport system permease protein